MDARLLEIEIHERLLIRDIEKTLQILTALKPWESGSRSTILEPGIPRCRRCSDFRSIPSRSIVRSSETSPARRKQQSGRGGHRDGQEFELDRGGPGSGDQGAGGILREHACDEFQGFYFNRPLPPDEFARLLLAHEIEGGIESESRSA